jgi:hypothetical protein
MKSLLLASLFILASTQLMASTIIYKPVSVLSIAASESYRNLTRYDLILSDDKTGEQFPGHVTCHKTGSDQIIVECDFRTGSAFGLYCSTERQASVYRVNLNLPEAKCSEIMNKLSTTSSKIILNKNTVVGVQ